MKAVIHPGKLNGTIPAPPSKSYAHRMLIGAALAEGESVLNGISSSEDMLATMDCLAALGAEVSYDAENQSARIRGIHSRKSEPQPQSFSVFPCRESGSTLRFFIPIALALLQGGRFTGAGRLIERGIGIYEELFAERGITVEKTEQAITVQGRLSAGEYRLKGDVSSQFVTGLLFALSLLKEESCIRVLPPVESRAYIDITIDVMKTFGVQVSEPEENCFVLKGGQSYTSGVFHVEGDWSNAAFLYGFQTVGNNVSVTGLKEDSMQGDKVCVRFFRQMKESEEQMQKGGEQELPLIDLSGTPDLGPVLFAAAAVLGGRRFIGTRRLRIKESDRAQAMAEELQKFGVETCVEENEVTVFPSAIKKPAVPLYGHNDHRIVMALSILCSLTGGEIEGCEAVRKSWPDFFGEMQKNGLPVQITD